MFIDFAAHQKISKRITTPELIQVSLFERSYYYMTTLLIRRRIL